MSSSAEGSSTSTLKAAPPVVVVVTDFDFESECLPGRDPDKYSPTLRAYQQALWTKPLPDGTPFDLQPGPGRGLLRYRLNGTDLILSSDSIVTTYHGTRSMQPIVDQVPKAEQQHFYRVASTIAAKLIFPAEQIDRKITINGARGINRRIADRMDLTLECIRRHYLGEPSPLAEVLARYAYFFDLFVDFVGYVDFFLLQDLVTDDYATVRFHLPFQDFASSGLPADLTAYQHYVRECLLFLAARSSRITQATKSDRPHPK